MKLFLKMKLFKGIELPFIKEENADVLIHRIRVELSWIWFGVFNEKFV